MTHRRTSGPDVDQFSDSTLIHPGGSHPGARPLVGPYQYDYDGNVVGGGGGGFLHHGEHGGRRHDSHLHSLAGRHGGYALPLPNVKHNVTEKVAQVGLRLILNHLS